MDLRQDFEDPSVLWTAVRREVDDGGAAPEVIIRKIAEAHFSREFEQRRAADEMALNFELRDLPIQDRRRREAARASERAQILFGQDLLLREFAAELEHEYLRQEFTRLPFPRKRAGAEKKKLAAQHLLEDTEMLDRHERDLGSHHAFWSSLPPGMDESQTALRESRRQENEHHLAYLHGLELDNLKARHKVETIRLGISLEEREEHSQDRGQATLVETAERSRRRKERGMGLT